MAGEDVRALERRNASSWFSLLFVLAIGCGAYFGEALPSAVYLLGFWHYYLYWLAFHFRSIPLDVFKRDAMAMKAVAIAPLAASYLTTPVDLVSLAVIVCGILLNISAAAVLGADRTYYGREVANLPPRQIKAFPYSLTAHPMLIGNVAAFGGALINPEFRDQWWPLAGAHVVLNFGLLLMELAPPRHGSTPGARLAGGMNDPRTIPIGCAIAAVGGALGAALGQIEGWNVGALPGFVLGASVFGYAFALYACYAPSASAYGARQDIVMKGAP